MNDWIEERSAILENCFGFSRQEADAEAKRRYKLSHELETTETIGNSGDLLANHILADRPNIKDV